MSRPTSREGATTSRCRFRETCHFYGIGHMTPHSARMKELHCIEWPEKCAIYVAKMTGKPVPITQWPAGRLQTEER